MARPHTVLGIVLTPDPDDPGRLKLDVEGGKFNAASVIGKPSPGEQVWVGFLHPEQRRQALAFGPLPFEGKELPPGLTFGVRPAWWAQAEGSALLNRTLPSARRSEQWAPISVDGDGGLHLTAQPVCSFDGGDGGVLFLGLVIVTQKSGTPLAVVAWQRAIDGIVIVDAISFVGRGEGNLGTVVWEQTLGPFNYGVIGANGGPECFPTLLGMNNLGQVWLVGPLADSGQLATITVLDVETGKPLAAIKPFQAQLLAATTFTDRAILRNWYTRGSHVIARLAYLGDGAFLDGTDSVIYTEKNTIRGWSGANFAQVWTLNPSSLFNAIAPGLVWPEFADFKPTAASFPYSPVSKTVAVWMTGYDGTPLPWAGVDEHAGTCLALQWAAEGKPLDLDVWTAIKLRGELWGQPGGDQSPDPFTRRLRCGIAGIDPTSGARKWIWSDLLEDGEPELLDLPSDAALSIYAGLDKFTNHDGDSHDFAATYTFQGVATTGGVAVGHDQSAAVPNTTGGHLDGTFHTITSTADYYLPLPVAYDVWPGRPMMQLASPGIVCDDTGKKLWFIYSKPYRIKALPAFRNPDVTGSTDSLRFNATQDPTIFAGWNVEVHMNPDDPDVVFSIIPREEWQAWLGLELQTYNRDYLVCIDASNGNELLRFELTQYDGHGDDGISPRPFDARYWPKENYNYDPDNPSVLPPNDLAQPNDAGHYYRIIPASNMALPPAKRNDTKFNNGEDVSGDIDYVVVIRTKGEKGGGIAPAGATPTMLHGPIVRDAYRLYAEIYGAHGELVSSTPLEDATKLTDPCDSINGHYYPAGSYKNWLVGDVEVRSTIDEWGFPAVYVLWMNQDVTVTGDDINNTYFRCVSKLRFDNDAIFPRDEFGNLLLNGLSNWVRIAEQHNDFFNAPYQSIPPVIDNFPVAAGSRAMAPWAGNMYWLESNAAGNLLRESGAFVWEANGDKAIPPDKPF